MATVQQLSDQAQVQDFTNLLTSIRAARINDTAQMTQLMSDIKSMTVAHQNLLDQFSANALAMHPELAGQDMKAYILTLPSSDPLYQLWLSASQTINDVRNAIAAKTMTLDQVNTDEQNLESQETQAIADYTAFSVNATTTVPTIAQLLAGLAAVSVIPLVDEQSTVASLPAIEELSLSAASAVTLQVAAAQTNAPVDLAVSVQTPQAVVSAPQIVQAPFSQVHPAIFYGLAVAGILLLTGKK